MIKLFGNLTGLLVFTLLLAGGRGFTQAPDKMTILRLKQPYYDGNKLQALLVGDKAEAVTGGKGLLFITGFELQKFNGSTNDLEVIIKAPTCYFHPGDRTNARSAWSEDRFQAFNPTTNFFLEGRGFYSELSGSNLLLVVSNEVHTVLLSTNAPATNTPAAPATPVEIFSDRLRFAVRSDAKNSTEANLRTERRIATYTRNVRVVDKDFLLHGDYLVLDQPKGADSPESIVMKTNVIITGKHAYGRATGEEAVYDGLTKVVTLSGDPTWTDGTNSAAADRFLFDRLQDTVFATGHGVLRVPASALNTSGGLGLTGGPGGTNLVDINADAFDIRLPTTNHPGKHLVARGHVRIQPDAASMASADEVTFQETTGLLRLAGHADWQTPQLHAQGDVLEINRLTQVFSARTNAYLKLISTNADGRTLTISCDHYDATTNVAHFRQDVIAIFSGGDNTGQLTCTSMDVYFVSNQVTRIETEGDVAFTQKSADGLNTYNLGGDKLALTLTPETGRLQTVAVKGDARLAQKETQADKVVNRALRAQQLDIRFATNSTTNRVEQMIAEGDVYVEQEGNSVEGQHAVYHLLPKESLEVTGNPSAIQRGVIKDGRKVDLQITGADVLKMDPATGRFSGKGALQIRPLPPLTNAPALK